jgi:acyl-CoA thioesterase-1
VPDGTDGVILELGANDMLRGIDPEQTRKNLDAMLSRLKERNIPVLVAGMRASPNLGPDYAARFDPIFPELAQIHGAALYPFFLDGVAAQPSLNQDDGMHPNSAGVDAIVARMIPVMEEFIAGPVTQAAAN